MSEPVCATRGAQEAMRALPLMLQPDNTRHMLPALTETLQPGDPVLFCGRALARSRMRGITLSRSLAPLSAGSTPIES